MPAKKQITKDQILNAALKLLRNQLIPLVVAEFETYLKTGSQSDSTCLYGMKYIRFAKEEPRLFCFFVYAA